MALTLRPEQTRALHPDESGVVERDGVEIHYEVFGEGETTVVLVPPWSIVHSRHWKMQVPYLARHFRVVTYDGRGNGRSSRPESGYDGTEFAADTLAVMDATATDRAATIALSLGADWTLRLAADHPERVERAVFICPAVAIGEGPPGRRDAWNDEVDRYEGWAKYNLHYWQRDYGDFLEFFFGEMFPEPHSTKAREDCVGWGLETTPETLIATQRARLLDGPETLAACARVRCPVLVIQGEDDRITGRGRGVALAEATGGALVLIEGAGHGPHVRDPVHVNLLLRDFLSAPPRVAQRWRRGRARTKRALYVSSPIGLGHARRDVAIATELRRHRPELEIQWLAQHPVTRLLEEAGECIHPASTLLASESQHIESESADHDLHCFQAIRRMDEILLANFMVFHDVLREEDYDLVIGDEAWEVDHYLHENPEEKRAAYAWLTDFVGWLPMPDGGDHEAFLTADYNAEMITHIERFPRVRDRAIFIGDPDDIVPDLFGPGLPRIRDWTERHYHFAGYVTGVDSAEDGGRETLGYGPDERVCIVTVGGSGVGASLLERAIDAYPLAKTQVPDLRMIVVAGPRIDPATLPAHEGLEVRAYVHDLHRHLAVCDLAVVQGGLTTTMELVAAQRPFLYFPLRHHFEQSFHVPHRLRRYGAGRRMDFEKDGPHELAAAIAEDIGRPVAYRPVERGGAARAASLIAELV